MLLMSMMALAGAQQTDQVAEVLAEYHARTTTVVHCVRPRDETEIVVCSNRKADDYRVPLVLSASPSNSVPVRTGALLDEHRAPCGEGAFMVRCGYVGASVSVGAYGVHYVRREKAP